jgi:hypothetical protein
MAHPRRITFGASAATRRRSPLASATWGKFGHPIDQSAALGRLTGVTS